MEYYVVYHGTTGDFRWRAQGPEGTAASQVFDEEGLTTMVVPQAAMRGAEIDFAIIRQFAADQVDRAAEAFRLRFVTGGAAQAMTYKTKEAEAVAYLIDDTVPTPFLTAEAAALNMTVADLAAVVSEKAAAWTIIGSAIEARRAASKAAIRAATNLAQVADAIAIDWNALVS